MHTAASSSGPFDHEPPIDIDILNFALTLEHVENAFYTQGLSRFKQEDFVHAGFPDWAYGRLEQIATHEAAHVGFLEKILGDKATKPCDYKLSVVLGGSDFAHRWLTATTLLALMMIPSPLLLLAMPLKSLVSVLLSSTVSISHLVTIQGDSSYIGASKFFVNKVRSPYSSSFPSQS